MRSATRCATASALGGLDDVVVFDELDAPLLAVLEAAPSLVSESSPSLFDFVVSVDVFAATSFQAPARSL